MPDKSTCNCLEPTEINATILCLVCLLRRWLSAVDYVFSFCIRGFRPQAWRRQTPLTIRRVDLVKQKIMPLHTKKREKQAIQNRVVQVDSLITHTLRKGPGE